MYPNAWFHVFSQEYAGMQLSGVYCIRLQDVNSAMHPIGIRIFLSTSPRPLNQFDPKIMEWSLDGS